MDILRSRCELLIGLESSLTEEPFHRAGEYMSQISLLILSLAISPFSTSVHAQQGTMSIGLASIKQSSIGGVCKTYWNILNKTGSNIAYMSFSPLILDTYGRVIMKPSFVPQGLKNNETVKYEMLVNGQCSVVGTIKFNGIFQMFVDGPNGRRRLSLDEGAIQFTSAVAGVSVTP